MNRRPASLPKSPLNTRSFLRRALRRGPALLTLPLLALSHSANAANTEFDVINGQTDLTNAAGTTYTTGGASGTGVGGTATAAVPTVTSDVTFDSGVAYAPAAFTLNSSLTFGSLNDLSATALTIANTSTTGTGDTLTLGGAGDMGDGVAGSAAGDLLFVGTGANLTINSGAAGTATALGLVLGQSGNFDVAGTASIGSAVSGAFSFTKTGVGFLKLSGAVGNGGTITNAGTGTTGALVSTGATVPGAALYISGAIGSSVTGIVQNSATSDLLLGGNNSAYNNGITVQAGTLLLNNVANSLGAATDVVTLGNSSANATIQYGGRLGNVTGGNQSYANPINVNGTGTNVISATDYSVAFTGPITLAGGGTNLTLAGLNSGGSNVTITGGITGTGNIIASDDFANAGNTVFFTTSPVNNVGTITFNNAAVNGGTVGTANGTNIISGGVGANVTAITQTGYANSLTISTGVLNINSGGTTLTDSTTNGGLFTVSSAITGTGNLALNGASATSAVSIYLSGTNTYVGSTAINSGNVEFANVNAMPAGTAVTVASGSTLTIGVGTASPFFTNGTTGNGTIGGIFSGQGGQSGSTVALSSGSSVGIDTTNAGVTYAGNITNVGVGLNKVGANTLTLTGTNTYTGPTTVTAGTLQLGNGTSGNDGSLATPSITINGGTLAFDPFGTAQSYAGTISGAGGVSKIGAGTTTLSGVNTFTGATTVSAGTLDLTGANTGQSAQTVSLGGTLLLDHSVGTVGNILAAGDAVTLGSGGTLSVNGGAGGTDTQTVGSLALNAGLSTVQLTNNGAASNTLTITSGTLTRVAGGSVDFISPAGTSIKYGTATTAFLGTSYFFGTGSSEAYAATTAGVVGAAAQTAETTSGVNGLTSATANYAYTSPGTPDNQTIAAATANTVVFNNPTAQVIDIGSGGGTNTLTLNGLMNVGSGALTIQRTSGIGSVVIGSANELVISGSSNVTISAPLTGTGALTNANTGSLILAGANTYTGGTTVAAGTLQLSGTGTLGTTTSATTGGVTVSGGVLDLNGTSQTVSTLAGTGGSIYNLSGAGTSTLTIGANNGTGGNFAGVIADNNGTATGGKVAVVETGSGSVTLSGANTYTGGTTVNGTGVSGVGFLELDNATTNQSNSLLELGTGLVTLNGGRLDLKANGSGSNQTFITGNGITGNNVLVAASAGIDVNNFGSNTGSAVVLNNLSIGASTLTITGANGYSLRFAGTTTLTGNATLFTNTAALTLAGAVSDGGNGYSLTKTGGSALTLTGANTYTGPTTITAGTLQIGGAGTLGGGSYAALINDAGLLQYSSSAAQTLSGSISGSGGLTKDTSATSTLTLSGFNTFTGATNIAAGNLDLANQFALQNSTLSLSGSGAVTFDSAVTGNAFTVGGLGGNSNIVLQNNATTPAPIALTVGNPINNASSTSSGVLSGAGSLTLAGFSNTITLTGANTYTGVTTVTGATLNLGGGTANGSIGTGSNALVLGGSASGGLFNYTRVNGTAAEKQSFASTALGAGEDAVTTSTAYQTVNLGAVTSAVGATVDINPNTTSAITTTNGNTNGILGGYATFGGKTTWAVAPTTAGGAITGLATYTPSATAGTVPASYLNANVDVTASETLTGAINPNSLRFNSATAYTLTLTGLNTIQSGGILNTATASNGGTIMGGILTAGSGQLAVTNGNTGSTLTLGSLLVDNGAPTAVVASGSANGGYVSFGNASNSFSGGLYFNGGRLSFTSGGTAFGTGNVTFGNQIYTNAGGGGINFGANSVTSGLLVDAQGANASNGDISSGGGTGNWTLIGTGTASFAGIIGNYASGRVVNLTLDSGTQIIANTQLGSSAVTVNGGTMQVGNGLAGAYSNSANSVALNVGGGTFVELGNVVGTTAQPFNSGLVVNAGASAVTVNNNGGAGTLLSFAGAGSRAAGGTVNFTLPGGTQNATNGITTVNLNTNGIIGGYATVGGTDWAINATNLAGGNIIGLSASAINAYSNDTFGTGLNTNVTTSDTPASGFTTNSVRFNTGVSGGNTLTLNGTNTISSGGILETAAVGANATTIAGGSLASSATTDLIVIQNNAPAGNLVAGALTINSIISGGLTKSGPGMLILAPNNFGPSPNNLTGGVYLNGGVLNTSQNGVNGATLYAFNGGTLQAASSITASNAVTLGATGGTIDTNGNTVSLLGTVSGAIAGAGSLGGFNSTGAFALTVNDSIGGGILTLGGAGSAFNGGIIINGGTVQDGATAATTLGTGYVTFKNNTTSIPTLDLGGNSATVAGLIGAAGTNGVVTSSGTTASTLTLNGVSTQTYAGVINDGTAGGTVGLTVALNNPTEAQILTGANTYSGATTINAGKLLYNGTLVPAALGAGTVVTVNSGGTLGGSGMLSVTTATVATGGTLAPGATTGAVSGTLTLNTTGGIALNGTLVMGVSSTGNTSTLLATNNGLALGSGVTLLINGTLNGTSDYAVATAGSMVTGTFASSNVPSGYQVVYNDPAFFGTGIGGDIELEPTAIPEPSTTCLASALMLAVGAWRYRRNRQSTK